MGRGRQNSHARHDRNPSAGQAHAAIFMMTTLLRTTHGHLAKVVDECHRESRPAFPSREGVKGNRCVPLFMASRVNLSRRRRL